MPANAKVETLRWIGDVEGHLTLVDQTLLPVELREIECRTVEEVWQAIKALRVRGAPAIGIAAAYGVCLELGSAANPAELVAAVRRAADHLATSRPTAVNLFWALDRMRAKAQTLQGRSVSDFRHELLNEARAIHEEDRAMCHAIGRHGAALLADGCGVLTHCNAGGLATAEYGTALSVFFTAQDQGKRLHVYVDCDSMAGQVMREGRVQAVVTGADRIAANGDSANKIGTYSVAVLAQAHGIPFYIAAPSSTFDLTIANGQQIPIEERAASEITHGFGRQTAPEGRAVYNPAFDVTPAAYIRGIITERGVISPVNAENIARLLS